MSPEAVASFYWLPFLFVWFFILGALAERWLWKKEQEDDRTH